MTDAEVVAHHDTDGSVRLVVCGEIDLSNAATVEKRILEEIDNQLTDVELDLTDVDYVDSAGLRILFTLATRLEISQIALALRVPPSSPTRRVLEVTGMAAIATLLPGEGEEAR